MVRYPRGCLPCPILIRNTNDIVTVCGPTGHCSHTVLLDNGVNKDVGHPVYITHLGGPWIPLPLRLYTGVGMSIHYDLWSEFFSNTVQWKLNPGKETTWYAHNIDCNMTPNTYVRLSHPLSLGVLYFVFLVCKIDRQSHTRWQTFVVEDTCRNWPKMEGTRGRVNLPV